MCFKDQNGGLSVPKKMPGGLGKEKSDEEKKFDELVKAIKSSEH